MSDEIVKIPKTMEKFFKQKGKMVRPSIETVSKLIKKIPKGKVATLESFRQKVALSYKVEAACPAATMKSIKQAIQENKKLCFWRLVKKDFSLITQFPGGAELQASHLMKEGFEINKKKKNPSVVVTDKNIYCFG